MWNDLPTQECTDRDGKLGNKNAVGGGEEPAFHAFSPQRSSKGKEDIA